MSLIEKNTEAAIAEDMPITLLRDVFEVMAGTKIGLIRHHEHKSGVAASKECMLSLEGR